LPESKQYNHNMVEFSWFDQLCYILFLGWPVWLNNQQPINNVSVGISAGKSQRFL